MWRVSILLAPVAGGLFWAGAPLWLALAAGVAIMFAVLAEARAVRRVALMVVPVTIVAALIVIAGHALAGPSPAVPAVVTWQPGMYTSYGAGSFTVGVRNDGGSAAVLHTTIRVRFVNDLTAQVITDVTEPVNVTVPAGQGRELTYSAPQGLVNMAPRDRDVAVSVIDNN